jgi:polyribonucleotide nucleotidyltransferase
MQKTISDPRPELSQHAPRIDTMRIDPDKIRDVIGSGGKVINEIIEKCDVAIDIEQDGLVMITSTDADGAKKSREWIENIVKELAIGEIYDGTIVKIITDRNNGSEIGAIAEVLPGKDGMIHISQVSHERIAKVSDILKVGDKVKVKVMEVDKEKGRVSLSIKELLPKPDFAAKSNERPQRPSDPAKPQKKFFNKK